MTDQTSGTPRTDARDMSGVVTTDFARTLERDLASAQRRIERLREALEYARKYAYHHQRIGDKRGMQLGQVPTVYPEDMARIDAALVQEDGNG